MSLPGSQQSKKYQLDGEDQKSQLKKQSKFGVD